VIATSKTVQCKPFKTLSIAMKKKREQRRLEEKEKEKKTRHSCVVLRRAPLQPHLLCHADHHKNQRQTFPVQHRHCRTLSDGVL
jgi:hypothetical protein